MAAASQHRPSTVWGYRGVLGNPCMRFVSALRNVTDQVQAKRTGSVSEVRS